MVTKRHLGIAFTTSGALVLIAVVLTELLGAGNYSGIGPYQLLALIGGIVALIVGLTLIPLGDKPA